MKTEYYKIKKKNVTETLYARRQVQQQIYCLFSGAKIEAQVDYSLQRCL